MALNLIGPETLQQFKSNGEFELTDRQQCTNCFFLIWLEKKCFSAVDFSDLHFLKTSPFFSINKTLNGQPWESLEIHGAVRARLSFLVFVGIKDYNIEIYRHPLVDIVVNNSSKLYPMLSEPKRLFHLARFRKNQQ